ncbi:MAG: TadE/TadG family type IV pilus assembly protein [Acidocella sp.]|nr:TadE/TadG family type IV pilus assembly protein [Acidocella sp.]
MSSMTRRRPLHPAGLSRNVLRCVVARRGMATVEFALVAVPFTMFLLAILGAGLDGFYQLDLDDSVRAAARSLQIDTLSASDPAAKAHANFISAVCQEFGTLATNCATTISYDVQAATSSAGFSSLSPATLPANGVLNDNFYSNGTGDGYVDNLDYLIQVAYPLPFTLPFVSRLITLTGTSSIIATTTIRGEPF